jgi:hypothetical protein
MYVVFTLTMPQRNTWNGKWSGDNDLYAVVKKFTKKHKKTVDSIISRKSYSHSWEDGWTALIKTQLVTAVEAKNIKKKSKGFCGYEWMINNIIKYGSTREPAETVQS